MEALSWAPTRSCSVEIGTNRRAPLPCSMMATTWQSGFKRLYVSPTFRFLALAAQSSTSKSSGPSISGPFSKKKPPEKLGELFGCIPQDNYKAPVDVKL